MSDTNKQMEYYAYSASLRSVDGLLETIGALHTRNKGLQKGHATLTRRVQDLEEQLEGCHEAISRLTGVAQNHVKRRMATEDGKSRILNISSTPTPLSDRAVDAIIADVMKADGKWMVKLAPEPTAADQRLADDLYSLRRRIACDLHEWSQVAEPVLSRLAKAERAIELQNELLRRGK